MNFTAPKWLIHMLVTVAVFATTIATAAASIPHLGVAAKYTALIVAVGTGLSVAIHAAIGVLDNPPTFTATLESVHPAELWPADVLSSAYQNTDKRLARHGSILNQILALLQQIWAWIQAQPFPPVAPIPPVGPPAPPVPPQPVPQPPAAQVMAWIDQTGGLITAADCQRIMDALNIQALDLVRLWGPSKNISHVFVGADPNNVPAGAWKAYLLVSSDIAGALGYHDVDPAGDPYSRVFVGTILANGGTILSGSNSVSVCCSHEAAEQDVDPDCALNASAPNGDVWAVEVGDPVEAFSYAVTTGDGSQVSVSDFVTPQFFQQPSAGALYDVMGSVTQPFTVAAGGFAIVNGQDVFGDRYPEWRKVTKLHPASRTFRRHAQISTVQVAA